MSRRARYRMRRISAVIIAALLFGVLILTNPKAYEYASMLGFSDEKLPDYKAEQSKADSLLAKDVLEDLAVKEKDTEHKYYRKQFYDSWAITDSGCNTREAILARDLTDISYKDETCKVATGTLIDPYTGKTIKFERGDSTSAAVQIDHVVALSNAWSTGAYLLTPEERLAVSQDPLNLLAVDGPANQEKSDQAADTWLPSNTDFQCQYVARQISVKYKYHLWVTPPEKLAMQKVLATCPEEPTRGLQN
ncbi:MAG: HNH endonuclease family protein [Candidatus Saccharibacteria bacterium]|nr:HNH endonuclease family protein [Candidatus Saccharibacteria bacterium]